MSKKKMTIDETLASLYTSAGTDFNNQLSVAKLMVTVEVARLKQTEQGNEVPEFYQTGDDPNAGK